MKINKGIIINGIIGLILLIMVLIIIYSYYQNNDLLVAIIVGFLAFIGVLLQLKSTKNITTAGYILNLQDSFATNKQFNDLFNYCWEVCSENPHKKDENNLKNSIENDYTLVMNYMNLFESMYLMYKKGSFIFN